MSESDKVTAVVCADCGKEYALEDATIIYYCGEERPACPYCGTVESVER